MLKADEDGWPAGVVPGVDNFLPQSKKVAQPAFGPPGCGSVCEGCAELHGRQHLGDVRLCLDGGAGLGYSGKLVVQSGGNAALFGEGWEQDLQGLDFFAGEMSQSDCAMCPPDHFFQLFIDGKNRPIWIEAAQV